MNATNTLTESHPLAPLSPWGAFIFCRVIDNFGDAGVCWRLAGRLSEEGLRVLLIIDHPEVLERMVPELTWREPLSLVRLAQGDCGVMRWETFEATIGSPERATILGSVPPRLVMETFGCRLPERFESELDDGHVRLWMNLEYLTAEPYADDCHGLWGRHPTLGAQKLWFYPGFTKKTGGLFNSPDDRARIQTLSRERVLTQLGANPALPTLFFFSYPTYPVEWLADALATLPSPINVLIAEGEAGERLAARLVECSHNVCRLGYLAQAAFDEAIWVADLALIRGEESFVRAQLGAVPLIWSIYPTTDMAHEIKLSAWLARFSLAAIDERTTQKEAEALGLWQRVNEAWTAGCRLTGAEQKKATLSHAPEATARSQFIDEFCALWRVRDSLKAVARRWQATLYDNGDLASAILDRVPGLKRTSRV